MDIQGILTGLVSFISDSIIPFLMAIAFIAFLWNAFRFFILESNSESGREKARSLAIWSIIAFAVITSVWGLVNLLSNSFGFTENDPVLPDYMRAWCEEQYAAGAPSAEVQARCAPGTQ